MQGKARKSSSRDVKLFDKNRNDTVYLPIWLIMNELTLGDSIHIVKLMRESLRIKLAKKFGCTVKEFISWLECINLVRNICCHNGNLIDIELVTRPKVPTDFKDLLVTIDAGNKKLYTNNLAIIICIIVKLMSSINPKYRFGNLVNSIGRLLDEANSSGNYGFKSRESILECFSNSNIGKMSKI
ncbi:Abi family protein [Ligilactobacillus salivarius]|uniref:Abi family protein n=1 Tax=Ligilactobacillus salivarius TaxID=1624 RepID=A0ABD7YYT3_9LACO|nr:Abi family protein [Ligilactobacillus salivarius]WHS07004.1 Abi family protein [Ligilactobacillus salivarius]WHS08901.1 Abi family protein [Ligilactobacillus salivarius]WHS10954.1 Abi family protein [Ligilactobacillus salivarius]WHS15041.1 Abi family protein [Ligilactobacillus salivarius]WHS18523.1 Abi family protein [Ligilactobacillus salivarius]